jgi:uncharacterized membrane protein YcaP (DUF421 family)
LLEHALFGTSQPASEGFLPHIVNNLLTLSQQVHASKQHAHDRENNSDKQISTISDGLVQAKALMVRRKQSSWCRANIQLHNSCRIEDYD